MKRTLFLLAIASGAFFFVPLSASAAVSLTAHPQRVALPEQKSTLSWESPKGSVCQSYADVLNAKGQWVWTLSDEWQSAQRQEKGTLVVMPQKSTQYSLSCVVGGLTEIASAVVSIGEKDTAPPAVIIPAKTAEPKKDIEESQRVTNDAAQKSQPVAEQKISAPSGGGGGGGGGGVVATPKDDTTAEVKVETAKKQEANTTQIIEKKEAVTKRIDIRAPEQIKKIASPPKPPIVKKSAKPASIKITTKKAKVVVKKIIPKKPVKKITAPGQKKTTVKTVKKAVPKKSAVKKSIPKQAGEKKKSVKKKQ